MSHIINEELITTTSQLAFSDALLRNAFRSFLSKDSDYKNQYLQKCYNRAFDGYSYMGQADSLNQYPSDMLHTFVLSDFAGSFDFPIEFKDFFDLEWKKIKELISTIELGIIEKIGDQNLREFYKESVGHMVSCNYYPKVNNRSKNANDNKRLSDHSDVSLLTTFPFGVEEGLAYVQNDQSFIVGKKQNVFAFNGYLMQYITAGKQTALMHHVELPNIDEERYSFAFFSLVKPDAKIALQNTQVDALDYYRDYLNLF
ncbi:2OG-Fe(II) oxygenase family protein [Saccharicrinis aurantiacus]|uniref:2OG-Fe(II) oxygenase family protein n=1 Tax=Saccharicrinis aurantiacus TaxID=1849719 RepID=UPI0024908707|nr:2OG-Fe(II) oxygenase family protein [Saccharicrinis aurantiacus]